MVVIIRKDKKLHRKLHLLAFVLTGGMSAPITAVSAVSAASYNNRTRRLQGSPKRKKVSFSPEEIAYMKEHVPGYNASK